MRGKFSFALLLFVFYSCKKNSDVTPTPPPPPQTISDQKILFNSGDSIYFYDITNKKMLWSKFLKPSNIYLDSTKIFSTGASFVYSFGFNSTSGALWSLYTGALGYNPPPAIVWPVGNDSLVFTSGDFSVSVFATYKNSGSTKWKTDLKLPTGFTPSRTVDPVLINDKLIISGQHKVFCLNAISGVILWSYTTDNTSGESFTDCVSNGKIYHLESTGALYCLDLNGSLIWKKQISPFSLYTNDNITIKNGVLYLFSLVGQTAVDASTGNILWQKSYRTLLGSIQICYSDGKIYSANGRILVESAATGDSITAITPVPYNISYHIGGDPIYEKSYSNLCATSDKLISEMVVSGISSGKDTLFFFNTKDLSVYDKIILPGKNMSFPPVIFENGKVVYHAKSGMEN